MGTNARLTNATSLSEQDIYSTLCSKHWLRCLQRMSRSKPFAFWNEMNCGSQKAFS